MDREKKLVTLSMVILFFSLVVVYSLFYQVKGDIIVDTLHSIPSETSVLEQETHLKNPKTSQEIVVSDEGRKQFYENHFDGEGENISDTSAGNDAQQAEKGSSQTASSRSTFIGGNSPIILSGTDLYFGMVDSIELLGLEPEYILKDYKGFYYAKFEEEPYLKTIVQKLGGNIYTITSDAELVKNQLFGDKVYFVNLPEYKNKIVVMGLTVNNQHWLIQMSYEKYHHAKEYLKNLFL